MRAASSISPFVDLDGRGDDAHTAEGGIEADGADHGGGDTIFEAAADRGGGTVDSAELLGEHDDPNERGGLAVQIERGR